jgi:tetratricopeptide (TPR) repeat protein
MAQADKLYEEGIRQLSETGQIELAIDYLKRALSLYRQAKSEVGEEVVLPIEREVLTTLGDLYYKLGLNVEVRGGPSSDLYHEAARYSREAISIWERIMDETSMEDKEGHGILLGNLGFIYLKTEEYDKAIQTLEQALAIAREVGNKEGEAKALYDLNMIRYDMGELDGVEETLQRVLSLIREVKNRKMEGGSWSVLEESTAVRESTAMLYAL